MKPCKKTKVLFILPTLGAGGAERILITLMNNINRNRFTPEFLTLNDGGPIKEWIDSDIPFHSFKDQTVKTSIFKLYALVKKTQPDVIFTTMVHSNALALLMKIAFPHVRVIVREAALPSVLISKYGIKGKVCTLVYKLLYSKADMVISNCSQMLDDFENVIKIKTDNHVVLFNPVDTKRLYSQIPKTLEFSKDREETLHFVSVGRLSYEKGYDRLIKALKDFNPDKKWRLDIVGKGDYKDILEPLIKKNGLEDKIFLRGYHSNPWVIAANADCLLLPSRWEGMPNVVLEGFACGIPAIAMREAGGIMDIKEYVDSKLLNIVDTIDEFVAVMLDVKTMQENKKIISKLPNEFLLPHIIQQFENILKE